jgi:LysM repeat protein
VKEDDLRRWAARLAAPLAFFLGATILIVLVQRGLEAGDASTVDTPVLTSPTTSTGETTRATTRREPRRYRVRRGDTLESIAAKFDTTVDDLVSLNPGIDPLALSPGQRIRVS